MNRVRVQRTIETIVMDRLMADLVIGEDVEESEPLALYERMASTEGSDRHELDLLLLQGASVVEADPSWVAYRYLERDDPRSTIDLHC